MTFQAGPAATTLQAPPGETPPKRGPGRPRGPNYKPRSSSSRSRGSMQAQIAGVLMTFNLALYVVPGLRSDALDENEIIALSKALDEQAKTSPRFRKMLETALSATSGGQLLGVCVIIGARRAARHGVLPTEMDGMFGSMLAASVNQAPAPAPPAMAPEPEPASNGTS